MSLSKGISRSIPTNASGVTSAQLGRSDSLRSKSSFTFQT